MHPQIANGIKTWKLDSVGKEGSAVIGKVHIKAVKILTIHFGHGVVAAGD